MVIGLKYVLLQQSDDLHPEMKVSVSCFVLCTTGRISAGTPKQGKKLSRLQSKIGFKL